MLFAPIAVQRTIRTRLILFALWLMMFSASSQVIIVSPILPEISAALDVPEALQSWLVSIYAMLLCVFALITGPISDKIGRRRILLIGTACMAGALWLHGLADSFATLMMVRGLAGCAGGVLSGGAVAYVGDYFPYHRRGWANGWVMSGMAVGQILGIPIGKILADAFGFRWPFLMFAVTMTGATLLVARFVPQPEVSRSVDRLSVGRALRGYWRLVRERYIAAATAAYFLMFFAIGLFVVYLPTWLEGPAVNLSGTQVAVLFAVGGAANVVTGPVAGWLSDRVGRKPLIITSCLGLALLMALTTFVITDMVTASAFYGLAMVAVAMRIAPLQSLLTALVSSERRGILMSLAVGIGQIGIGGGSLLAGLAYAEYGYGSNTYIGAVAMVVMAALVWAALPEPRGEAASVPHPAPEVSLRA